MVELSAAFLIMKRKFTSKVTDYLALSRTAKLINSTLNALGKGEQKVTLALASRLKDFNRIEIISLAFYALSGLILLISLPFTDYAPQLGLLGILSLIVAYGVFTKRFWAPYLVFVLFVAASTFALYTLIVAGFTNVLVGLSMLGYLVLTWVFAIYLLLIRRKP